MLGTIFVMLKKIFWFLTVVVVVAVLAGGGALYWFVAVNPGEKIRPENIRSILGKESPVFYSDGVTRLGVFFDEAHRRYVSYEKIPVNFINALVASEDNTFFSHFGFDIFGIVRAAIKNIQAGRVVQGGSTLTQQTAKNLFKRENRSIKAKLKELLYALRLEYHYSKEQIFEFYANQFYVYGNGHGLGVAARYYFDKKPEELSLLQCAYIAGSVKRPNYYNPFVAKGEEATKKALERGRGRVDYVLGNMLELGMISEYQHGVASFGDIGFKQGRVGFPLDYVMDMVKDAASSPEVAEALAAHDITNVATSGVRIVTTVDKDLQERTLYSLRHDLSRLDVRLRGYERQDVQEELQKLDYAGDDEPQRGAFRLGVVETLTGDTASPVINVDLGRRFGLGVIDKSGISRLVEARVKWQKNPWTQAAKNDYSAFIDQLRPGDMVWVSIRGKNESGLFELDLEKFPQVNGGALVLKDGLIKAMAGGVENRFFNRAIDARRTMGSSFKPFVFAAAHQLGWNTTDTLSNRRDVFVFHNQPYFPRPDHHSPFDEVSLSWAGVKSENLASVWLLAHLCDRLTREQFIEVASHVGLAPRVVDGEEEPYSRFRSRIRDRNGIVVNDDMLRGAAYALAMRNIETDLIFAGRDLEYQRLQKLHYGLGFADFREAVETELQQNRARLSGSEREELELRLKILSRSYLQLKELRGEFESFRQQHQAWQQALDFSYEGSPSRETDAPGGKGRLYYDTFAKDYRYLQDAAASGGMVPVSMPKLGEILDGLDGGRRQAFWDDVYLDGGISVETFDLMQQQLEREMAALRQKPSYSMEVLEHVGDYRILVGLKYVVALAREMGVDSELEPVLSFPLGSNVVTLLETLRLYEAMATGEVVMSGKYDDENSDLLCIIDRIETSDGEVVYRPERTHRRLLAPETTVAIGHILENVVKFGTGRYADEHIKLNEAGSEDRLEGLHELGLSVPVLGKTGTANRYTNASFFGFLPALADADGGLSVEDGYAVGVYTGFDDNEPMKKGATRITGSGGALPIWSEIVAGIVEEKRYGARLDAVDLSFYGLNLKRPEAGQKNIGIDPDQGGIVRSPVVMVDPQSRYIPSVLTFGRVNEFGSFVPERQFLPFWNVSSIEEKNLRE